MSQATPSDALPLRSPKLHAFGEAVWGWLAARWYNLRSYFTDRAPTFMTALVPMVALSSILYMRYPLTTNYIFDEQEALLGNPYVNQQFKYEDAIYRDFWGLPANASIGSYRPVPNYFWRSWVELGQRGQVVYDKHASEKTKQWFVEHGDKKPLDLAEKGRTSWPQHLFNLFFHGVNGAIFTAMGFRLTRRKMLAWFAGTTFVTCALLTEAVSGVVGLADCLGGLGALLALAALGMRAHVMPFAVFLGVMLGLFSKESAIVCVPLVPVAALLSAPLVHPERPARVARAALSLVGVLAAFVVYTELRKRWFPSPLPSELTEPLQDESSMSERFTRDFMIWFHQAPLPKDPLNNPLVDAPAADLRVAGAMRVYFRGLVQVVFPWHLSGDYSAPQEPVPAAVIFPESVLGWILTLCPLGAALGLWVVALRREMFERKKLEAAPTLPREEPSYWQVPFKKYVTFTGRASRAEVLGFFFLNLCFSLVLVALWRLSSWPVFMKVLFAGQLLTAVPWAALVVRRLHDLGRSGKLALLVLVPVIGWIALVYLMASRGAPEENFYGERPRDADRLGAAWPKTFMGRNWRWLSRGALEIAIIAGASFLAYKMIGIGPSDINKDIGDSDPKHNIVIPDWLLKDVLAYSALGCVAFGCFVESLWKRRTHGRHDYAIVLTAIAMVWVVVSYFPHSNMYVLLPTVRAERLWYFPVLGTTVLVTLALGGAYDRLRRSSQWRDHAWMVPAVFLTFQAGRAYWHATDYRDDLIFWRETKDSVPNSAKAHLNYSVMAGARGMMEIRLQESHIARNLAPDWSMAHVYTGDTLCRWPGQTRVAEAWPHYARGFEIGPNEKSLITLALQCLWDTKALKQHEVELRDMIKRHPGTWLAHLGNDILANGDSQGGVQREHKGRGYNQGAKKKEEGEE